MGLTNVKLKISNPSNKNKTREVNFLVDSGAFYSFVDGTVLKEIGIKPETTREVMMANGKHIKRRTGIARFHFRNIKGGATVVFGEKDDENLLGATTLEALGLMLNPFKREIIPMTLTA